jgi:hypothetical protein
VDDGPDYLRTPSVLDRSAEQAKDWLHLNLFDHATATTGIINTSLHGDPRSTSGIAVGCCLVHRPGVGWRGDVEVRSADSATIDRTGVGLGTIGLALNADGALVASVLLRHVRGSLVARPAARAVVVENRMPFGSGWISWRAVPRLRAEGSLVIDDSSLDVTAVDCYCDHNWGRWQWGDDAGWDYGAFLAPNPGPSFVLSRPTDRAHRIGLPRLTVHVDGHERRFSGATVRLDHIGCWNGDVHRVPGAMAALRSDRRSPHVPERIEMYFDDGFTHGHVLMTVGAAAQIVCGEPSRPGTSFIHELCGGFRWELAVDGERRAGDGLGVFEHVD